MFAAAVVPLGFFAAVTLIVVYIARYRNRERMEIIKTGMTPYPAVPGKASLLWGLLLTFVGCAFTIAVLIIGLDKEAHMAGALSVSTGIALLLYYKITIPDREKAEELHRAMIAASADRTQPEDSYEGSSD